MKRGQAWGVMEVLVATIILGMSMGIVFYALRNIEDTKCVAELKSQTVALQNAMLDVALGSPPTTRRVVYKMPQCGDRSVEALRFAYYKTRELCRLCPGQYSGCWIIEPTVYDYKQRRLYRLDDAATCINMPADISLAPVKRAQDSKCLGDQMTSNPCPQTLPDGSGCTPAVHKVPQNVFNQNNPLSSNSRWATFGRKPGDGRVFLFELRKDVESTTAGLVGLIRICPTTDFKR